MRSASSEQIERLRNLLLESYSLTIDTEVIKRCIEYVPNYNFSDAAGYIACIVRSRKKPFHLQTNRAINLVDLGWENEVKCVFRVIFEEN